MTGGVGAKPPPGLGEGVHVEHTSREDGTSTMLGQVTISPQLCLLHNQALVQSGAISAQLYLGHELNGGVIAM